MRVKIIVFSSLWWVLTTDSLTSIFRVHISFQDCPNSFEWPTDGLDTSCCSSSDSFDINVQYGNTGCRVFKRGTQNWKDFCLKINIQKRNYWILRIGLMGKCQKVPTFDFQSQFSMSKIIRIFLNFFFIEEYQLRSTFVVIDIFW